ncbi:hypothetical protein GX48_04922 [Paracoccidioides brasiliensis]|nr:hypothetical protein GX48_04922 [Paracoccidioides brasiliensis]
MTKQLSDLQMSLLPRFWTRYSAQLILLSFLLDRKQSPPDAVADVENWVAKASNERGKVKNYSRARAIINPTGLFQGPCREHPGAQRVIYCGSLAGPTRSCVSVLCFCNRMFDVEVQSGRPSGVLFDEMLFRSLPSRQADWDGFYTSSPALLFVEVICQAVHL